jgi:hypothetical protein
MDVIGWVILAAMLVPALALGRWAEHVRQVRGDAGAEPRDRSYAGR